MSVYRNLATHRMPNRRHLETNRRRALSEPGNMADASLQFCTLYDVEEAERNKWMEHFEAMMERDRGSVLPHNIQRDLNERRRTDTSRGSPALPFRTSSKDFSSESHFMELETASRSHRRIIFEEKKPSGLFEVRKRILKQYSSHYQGISGEKPEENQKRDIFLDSVEFGVDSITYHNQQVLTFATCFDDRCII